MKNTNIIPGVDGEKYIPYESRSGEESIVYYTSDLSAEGLARIFDRIGANLTGKVGIKLHTGEKNGPIGCYECPIVEFQTLQLSLWRV